MEGFLLTDKPDGMTSHDVVARIRRLTNEKRVGHAGTLDPFATGLLIVGIGRAATREMSKLVGLDKKYEAEFVLGASSDTDDRTGTLEKVAPGFSLGEKEIKKALQQFVGKIEQIPPAYSAIKIKGQKMYEAARKGKPIKAKSRLVTIFNLELVSETPLRVRIHCSSGTYIRAIARDLGKELGTGGYVQELKRTSIGPYFLKNAYSLEKLTKENIELKILPVKDFLSQL